MIQRAGIFAQTGLSYVVKFENEAIFHRQQAKGMLRSESKILTWPQSFELEVDCSFCQFIGLTCNTCSYFDNAIRAEARPLNLFAKGSRLFQVRLLLILDSPSWLVQRSWKKLTSAFHRLRCQINVKMARRKLGNQCDENKCSRCMPRLIVKV